MVDQSSTKIEKQLQESEKKFRLLYEEAPLPYQSLDENACFLEVNQAWLNTMGYAKHEVIGRPMADFLHPDHDIKKFQDVFNQYKKSGEIRGAVYQMVRKDGTSVWISFNGKIIKAADGTIIRTHGIGYDITAEIEAKKALNQKEERYRGLFEHMTSGVAVYEAVDDGEDFIFKEFNRAAEQIEHVLRKDVIGKRVTEAFPGIQDFGLFEIFQRVFKTGQPEYFPMTIYKDRRDAGSWRENWVYKLNSGEIVAVYNDITQRIRTEQARQQELEITQALAAISEKLIASDYDIQTVADLILDYARKLTGSQHGFVSAIDPKTRENIGYTLTNMMDECRVKAKKIRFSPDASGKYPSLFGHALNTLEPFLTNDPAGYAAAQGVPEGHIPLQNFLSVPVALDKKPAGQIALANKASDYTERDLDIVRRIGRLYALALKQYQIQKDKQRIETQLLQAQKLEAIGTLAGGIAHDFNNILSAIIGYSELSLEELGNQSPLTKYLKEVLSAGKRAKKLVEQILTFSRQGEKELIPIELSGIIREALRLLRATLPSTIDIKQTFNIQPALAMANPTQIHQVIMNLCTNAAHAMEDRNGVLEFTLSKTFLDSQFTLRHPDLSPGDYLRISVSDTGCGMAPELLPHIFDPYFTTKERGKGTGLGLSTVLGIVKLHKGGITVYSEPGIGSVFNVYLPYINSEKASSPKEPLPQKIRGEGHILVVDDEKSIVEMLKQMLSFMGYIVTAATSSVELLDIFKAAPHHYHAVITDMTMPHMTGDRLALEIKKIRPDIPVILTTGFSEKMSEDRALELGIDKFLMKPITTADLSAALQELLEKDKFNKN